MKNKWCLDIFILVLTLPGWARFTPGARKEHFTNECFSEGYLKE